MANRTERPLQNILCRSSFASAAELRGTQWNRSGYRERETEAAFEFILKQCDAILVWQAEMKNEKHRDVSLQNEMCVRIEIYGSIELSASTLC